MNSLRRKKALKAIAAFVAFAVAQVYVQISLAEPPSSKSVVVPQNIIVGRLTTRNNLPITINGNSAATGASIQTGATIQTPPDVGATINLGPLGSVDLAPNTIIKLEFDESGKLKVTLISGCVIVTAKKNTESQVDTEKQQNVAKTDKKAGGILDVCFPPGAASPTVGAGAAASAGAGAGAATAGGLGTGVVIAIIGGGIAAGVGIPIALRSGTGGGGTVSGSVP